MKQKSKKKSNNKKPIDKLDIAMILIILLLAIFIIFQVFKLIKEIKYKETIPEAYIVFPILEKNSNSSITLTMSEFKKDYIYRFIVTNYRNTNINKEQIKYTISISNEDETDISIYKNENKKDLATSEKSFKISGNKLKAKEKQSDVYELKLNDTSNVTKDSKVIINIES